MVTRPVLGLELAKVLMEDRRAQAGPLRLRPKKRRSWRAALGRRLIGVGTRLEHGSVRIGGAA